MGREGDRVGPPKLKLGFPRTIFLAPALHCAENVNSVLTCVALLSAINDV